MTQISLTNNFNSLIGQAEDWTKAQTNFTDITTVVNGQLADDNFASTAGMYSAYRTAFEAQAGVGNDLAAGTYLFLPSGIQIVASGSTSNGIRAHWLDSADFAITGRTTKLRVRATVESNATAPGINFTVGFVLVTVAGAADFLAYTTSGAAVSSVAINTPPASTATVGTGTDFNVPATGLYAPFVITSGTLANNSACSIRAELQQRWV